MQWRDHPFCLRCFQGTEISVNGSNTLKVWQLSTSGKKLQWLHVSVAGKARVAPIRSKNASYKQTKKFLFECFKPPSKSELYKNKLQCLKRQTENWSDFADEVSVLTDKAYLELQEEARERIALHYYLNQLEDSRIALGVRQRRKQKPFLLS